MTDASGATTTEPFTFHVNVLTADVALKDFFTNNEGVLQVSYTIGNEASAPFQISIYSSPDGTTPDQPLGSYMVGSNNSDELDEGSHIVPITESIANTSGDCYLIAVADNTIPFDGGVFQTIAGTAVSSAAEANPTVTLSASSMPLWIYGGSGNDTILNNSSGNSTTTIDIPAGKTLKLSGTNTTGSLVETGSGTLILTGSSMYGGGMTINGGTLQLGDGLTSNGSVGGNITDNSTLVFDNPTTQTYSGVISGSGNLVVDGALTLNGANTFTGTTTIDAAGDTDFRRWFGLARRHAGHQRRRHDRLRFTDGSDSGRSAREQQSQLGEL